MKAIEFKSLVLFTSVIASVVTAQPVLAEPINQLPGFEPATVSKMAAVTAEALRNEEIEFQYVEARENAIGQLGVAQAKHEVVRQDYERKKDLVTGPSVSQDAYAQSMYDYESNVNEINRFKALIEFNTSMAEAYKIRVLTNDKPAGNELRKEVQFRLRGQTAKLAALKSLLATHQLALKLTSVKEQHGKLLVRSGSVSEQTMDLRVAAELTASQNVASSQREIELCQKLIVSLEETLRHL